MRFSGLFVVALSIALLNSCSQIAQLLPSYFTRMISDDTVNEVEENEEPHSLEDEEEDMDESLLDDPEPEPEPARPSTPIAKTQTQPAQAAQDPAKILPSEKQMAAAYKWMQEQQQKEKLAPQPQAQQPLQPHNLQQAAAPATPNTIPHGAATPAATPTRAVGIPTPPSTGLRTAPYLPYQNESETPAPARTPDPAQQRGLRSPGLPKLLPMDFDGKIHS